MIVLEAISLRICAEVSPVRDIRVWPNGSYVITLLGALWVVNPVPLPGPAALLRSAQNLMMSLTPSLNLPATRV